MKYEVVTIAKELNTTPTEIANFLNKNKITGVGKNGTCNEKQYKFIIDNYKVNNNKSNSGENIEIKTHREVVNISDIEKTVLSNVKMKEYENNKLKNVLLQYNLCYGYEIIYCNFIAVPFTKRKIEYHKNIYEKLNCIETIIFDIINSKIFKKCNSKKIANFININHNIVGHYVSNLINTQMLIENDGNIIISEKGEIAYMDGMKFSMIQKEEAIIYYNSKINVAYKNAYTKISISNYSKNNYQITTNVDNNKIIQYLIDCGVCNEEDEITIDKCNDSEYYEYDGDYDDNEIWYYDKDGNEYCETVDYSSFSGYKKYNDEEMPFCQILIYNYIDKCFSILLFDMEHEQIIDVDKENQEDKDRIIYKTECNERIEATKELRALEAKNNINIAKIYNKNRQNANSNKSIQEKSIKSIESSITRLYDSIIIREKFLKCFTDAQNMIIIQCPWIKHGAIDKKLVNAIQESVYRNVSVFILYGIDTSEINETSHNEAIYNLVNITNNGTQKVFVCWTGNNHTKEVVVDKQYDMFGSFNILSYNPQNDVNQKVKPRNESMEIIYDETLVNSSHDKYVKSLIEYFTQKMSEDYIIGLEGLIELSIKINSKELDNEVGTYIDIVLHDEVQFERLISKICRKNICEKIYYNTIINYVLIYLNASQLVNQSYADFLHNACIYDKYNVSNIVKAYPRVNEIIKNFIK